MTDETNATPATPETPPQPEIDPRVAIEVAAQQYGVTPEFLDGAIRTQEDNRRVAEEIRRTKRELETERIRLETLAQERQRYQPAEPQYDVDPAVRPVYDRLTRLESMLLDERKERAEREAQMEEARLVGDELHSHFQTLMRSVPSQNQMDPERFFGAMSELWPGGPPAGITPERAVQITARYLNVGSNGGAPYTPPYNPRDRRAPVFIPGSAPATAPAAQDDGGPQRPGESLEEYVMRRRKWRQDNNVVPVVQEGVRYSSE